MKRFNIFYAIHKAMRALLYETATLLQQADFSMPEDATEALNSVETAIALFDKHAESEDHFILSAISRLDAPIREGFTADHVKDFELTTRMRGLLTAYAHGVAADDKASIGYTINESFVEFMLFNLALMAKKERVLNPILWKHYSDSQLRSILNELQGQVAGEYSRQVMKWKIRGLNNSEIIQWLKQVENSDANELTLCCLLNLVESELSPCRRNKIVDGMTEGALLADC